MGTDDVGAGGLFVRLSSDVRLDIDLADSTSIELYRPEELIERRAQAAERALPGIRQVRAEPAALASG